ISPNPGAYGGTATFLASVTATSIPNLTGGPVGSVEFFDNSTSLGTAVLTPGSSKTSNVLFSISTLAVGNHSITAVYTPSTGDFLPSQQSPIPYTIAVPDFTITAAQLPFFVPVNGSATDTLILTSTTGFQGPIQITCPTTVFASNTCAISPTTVTLTVGGTGTTTLTVTNKSTSQTTGAGFWGYISTPTRISFAALFPLAFLLLPTRRRRLPRTLILTLCLLSGALSLTGCQTGGTFITLDHFDIIVTASGTSAGLTTPTTHTLDIPVQITK
ncbi:MAG: Ig-like domain-containing protein, partial [Bryocella sp.]